MKRTQLVTRWRLRVAIWVVAGITAILTLLELIPFYVALQAGIAGLSIVIFAPLACLLAILAYHSWKRALKRPAVLASLASFTALLAFVGPSLAYLATANDERVGLTFDPASYVKFTGDSISPARTITYKTISEEALKLSIYQQGSSSKRSTALLLHGGGWQYGTHLRTNNWPKLLRENGYQVISIQYRLAEPGKPTWDKAPQDIADAVTYVKEHADELGVNPDKIALFGQSAGGHLALLEAHRSKSVQSVIGLYSPIDLKDDYTLSVDKGTELAFLGGTPTERPDRYNATSVWLAASRQSPPTLLIQGTSDDIVHHSAAIQFGRLLENYGVKQKVVLIPYTGHSFDNQVGGFATQIAEKSVLDFLDSTLR